MVYRTELKEERFFHVNIHSRIKYEMENTLFSIRGNLIIADSKQARLLSDKINKKRKNDQKQSETTPGQIKALGILHEIFHYVINFYETEENPKVFERLLGDVHSNFGILKTEKLLTHFVNSFPPLKVYLKELTTEEYLNASTGKKPNREIILEEILLIFLQNINYPFLNLKELFDDTGISEGTIYTELISYMEEWFEKEVPFSAENLSLIKSLKQPILKNPKNYEEQLQYIIEKWGVVLDKELLKKILQSKDLIKEEFKLFIPHGGTGTPPVPDYSQKLSEEELKKLKASGSHYDDPSIGYYVEYEKFTQDLEWMPKVVMLAKNIFVWLDQLSRQYGREIKRLDEIPDEELDKIAGWHFTALWLIGLWERSAASRKIKQFCGNPEAASSAYSLYDYEVANELGGEGAFQSLKYRCGIRGIRLSSDMVPNHTGIFSKWLLENPHYFIQREDPPYPGYTFSGPDLLDDPRYQIRIEDKYYSKQDAAVVFQMVDNFSGYTRYIYHGNDGTNMPWNDTAQLNLLNADVRESLIQTIMHVARMTPIIRFDAAMTLTKKHFQRLWFPHPGTGGAIPSRSDYALTRKEFDDAIPNEFWREVVDRMNAEMPNTLLLAEAFWLMEGYFVRTLGMHRVYNSAFMHMFMKEENEKYRELITNTLEFNPEILKRYVNFMSNPDEETAVNQFGKGDKYFGIAVMLVTLPGLPMFAHGQLEGFTEKYGMEYKKAYYNEYVDEGLVKRHEYEIFPLMKQRHLFSQVENFELYDFNQDEGGVNQNVFAFTNTNNKERAIVIYNNSYEQTRGRIKLTTGKVAEFNPDGTPKLLGHSDISESLGLNRGDDFFYICMEHKTKLESLLSAKELSDNGLWITLSGYEYKVFLEFREVKDTTGEYKNLYNYLNGKTVKSVEDAKRELALQPLHTSVIELFNFEILNELNDFVTGKSDRDNEKLSPFVKAKISSVASEIKKFLDVQINEIVLNNDIEKDFIVLRQIIELLEATKEIKSDKELKSKNSVKSAFILFDIENGDPYKNLFSIYIVIRRFIQATSKAVGKNVTFNELVLQNPVWYALIRLSSKYELIKEEYELIKILATSEGLFSERKKKIKATSRRVNKSKKPEILSKMLNPFEKLLSREEIKDFIGVNNYEGVDYFSKERFELLLKWNFTLDVFRCGMKLVEKGGDSNILTVDEIGKLIKKRDFYNLIKEMNETLTELEEIAGEASYKLEDLLTKIK